MALNELNERSPIYDIADQDRETRIFRMTALTDAPERGALATTVSSSFPAGWIVDGGSYVQNNVDQDNNAIYELTVTAVPGINATVIGGFNEDALNPSEWFTVEEELTREWVAGAGANPGVWVPYYNVIAIYHTLRWYSNSTRSLWLGKIRAKLSKTNDSDNMPLLGFTTDEWRLTGVPMEPRSRTVTQVEWIYTHAGKDRAGADITWTQKGTKQFLSVDEKGKVDTSTVPTFVSGDIRALASNANP